MKDTSKKYLSKADALKKLARYCAYQERCHQEVRNKLLNLGIYGDDLEEIIVELIAENFLNEERFARAFARGKFRFKSWGRVRIRRELKMRDISEYCIKKAMEELEEFDYEKSLEEFLLRKSRFINEVDLFKKRRKLADQAIRRGYESKLVWDTLKRLNLED